LDLTGNNEDRAESGMIVLAWKRMARFEHGVARTKGRMEMRHTSTKFGALLAGAAVLALAGCQQGAKKEASEEMTLPISINAAMVGTVSHSADYIFALSNGDMPKNDHDWDLVRSAAYETMLGGKVIQLPGTGSNDANWVKDPEWKGYADQLTVLGGEAEKLVEERSTDKDKWNTLGGQLVDDCLACHMKFKPEIPSQGILHGSTERESRGVSIFS
jgi:cytochrome c556